MPDIIQKAIIDNQITVLAVNSTATVNRAIKLHDLSPVAAAALGRTLTVAALMANSFKNPTDYLTAVVSGNGPLGSITACADGKGNVKGCVDNNAVDNALREDGHLDVGGAVGKVGKITVIKNIGLKQPYVGTCNLITGEIAEDFANYFYISEQQPCALSLGVKLQKGKCIAGGGLLVQVLPQCSEELLAEVEKRAGRIGEISTQLQEKPDPKDVIDSIFGDMDNVVYTEPSTIKYKCDCSMARIKKLVVSLGKKEAHDIVAEQGFIEVQCHFCGKKYRLDEQAVNQLFEDKKSRKSKTTDSSDESK